MARRVEMDELLSGNDGVVRIVTVTGEFRVASVSGT